MQVAKVLLEAGMGEAARAEARLAVKLDPNSALGRAHAGGDSEARPGGPRACAQGATWAGAAEAYRAAIKLDSDDHAAHRRPGDPAGIRLRGRRYSGQAKMKEAIAEYQKLGQDKLTDLGLTDNLAFALFYGGDYAGAYKAAQALNPEPKALMRPA